MSHIVNKDYFPGLLLVINEQVLKTIKNSGKPALSYPGEQHYVDAYNKFFDKFLPKK
jgi:hypothetical protein